VPSRVHGLHRLKIDYTELIAKLFGNVAQSPSAVLNLLHFRCFSHKLPSRGRPGYIFTISSHGFSFLIKKESV